MEVRMSDDAVVVVVGAGPVGLALASELEIAGVHAIVLDQLASPDPLQKGRGIGVLGTEALRRRGLGRQLQEPNEPGRSDYRQDMGSALAHFAWIHKIDPSHVGADSTNRSGALIWQPTLERLLAEYATSKGAEVRRSRQVTALEQDATGVHLTVETPDGTETISAPYVVGCDGGRSSVRKLTGFEFPGLDATSLTRVARIQVSDPDSFPAPRNTPLGSFQHGGVHEGWARVRIGEAYIEDEDRDRDPLTVGELHDAIRRTTGAEVEVLEIREGRRARDTSRVAASYRAGRVFIAGDAAHVHTPLGGQGLNLGVMDAVNLGWKLASVVRGNSGEALLDTYSSERQPVGASVIANTRAQAVLSVAAAPNEALRALFTDLMDMPDVHDYLARMLTATDVRYPLPYAIDCEHELLGTHVPDFVVDDETLYSLAHDGSAVLVSTPSTSEAAAAAEPWADRVKIVPALVLGRRDVTAILLRPDGVLAWVAVPGRRADLDALTAALTTWLGPAAK
jgi:2-polyprenyl-6-methoxyphenol hydroxylase-like FAD-dependent oxidoreductase